MATGTLLPAPVLRAVDASGLPLAGALLQFYLTTTTTPTPVYTTKALTTPLANPVVADGGGLFPAIYLDPTVTYRAQLKTSGGSLIADIDPVNASFSAATQTQVNAGTDGVDYVTPLTLAAWTGIAAALGYTPVNKAADTATNLTTNPASGAATLAGYLGAPANLQNANYTLGPTDAGKKLMHTDSSPYTWTVPTDATPGLAADSVVGMVNIGAGVITIAPAAGVTLYLAGAGTTGNRTLAQWGVATLMQVGADIWLIGGVGVT